MIDLLCLKRFSSDLRSRIIDKTEITAFAIWSQYSRVSFFVKIFKKILFLNICPDIPAVLFNQTHPLVAVTGNHFVLV